MIIELTNRQEQIIQLVRENAPITSEQLAEKLSLSRAALRADLTVLTMIGEIEARPKIGYFHNEKVKENDILELMTSVKVSALKSKAAVVFEETIIYDAIVTLFLQDAGTLYVENNNGIFQGVVSRKDIIKIATSGGDLNKMPIGMIMSRMPNIISIHDDDSAYAAVKKIIEYEIDSLPVIEKFLDQEKKEQYKITGKISKTNMTKFLYDLTKNEGEQS